MIVVNGEYDQMATQFKEYARRRGMYEPVILIEESRRFKKPAVLRVYRNLLEAREAMQRLAAELARNRRCFEMSVGGREITWYGLRLDHDKGVVRFVRAHYEVKFLSEMIDGHTIRTEEDLYGDIER